MITWLLPRAGTLSRPARLALAAGMGLIVLACLGALVQIAFGVGGRYATAMLGVVPAIATVIAALIVIVRAVTQREHRTLWVLIAAAMSSYAIAFVLWGFWLQHDSTPPEPSIADVFWIGFYLLLAAAFLFASRGLATSDLTLRIWLDALLAASALAAIGTAYVIPPIVHSVRASDAVVTLNVFYPLADLVIGVVIVALCGIRGWRLERQWVFVMAAVVLWLAADCIFSAGIIRGRLTGPTTSIFFYMAAYLAVGACAWQPDCRSKEERAAHWSSMIMPLLFTLTAPTILVIDHFNRVPLGALILTTIALLVSMARLGFVLRDHLTLNEVRQAALTDDLTQLPNRRAFYQGLQQLVEQGYEAVTVMMLDLDNFKQINDTLGHDAGDELLRMVGPRLREGLPSQDIVARLGGDEFAILLAPDTNGQAVDLTAETLLDMLRKPFRVQDLTLRLTASIGIACLPRDADSIDTLIKRADVALYQAKESRKGWETYSRERDQYTPEKLELADSIASALEQGRIEAFYQPIAETSSGRLTGAEALVRWRQPDGTLRPPGAFLDALETAGLSRTLTRRMLDLALSQLRAWRAAGHDLRVSVNATVADLLDESFPGEVLAALDRHSMPPAQLLIEVTESSIMADPGRVGSVLARLYEMGVRIALDDFGTGYSSLTHLRSFPVHTVKIDRSFVSAICDHPADAAIVSTTIQLAHQLGLTATAEGVEDERTWSMLREMGADRIQGYVYGRPMSSDDFVSVYLNGKGYLAPSQSGPDPASTARGGSIG